MFVPNPNQIVLFAQLLFFSIFDFSRPKVSVTSSAMLVPLYQTAAAFMHLMPKEVQFEKTPASLLSRVVWEDSENIGKDVGGHVGLIVSTVYAKLW